MKNETFRQESFREVNTSWLKLTK